MDGCSASQQHKVDDQPSVTLSFWDLPICHIDTSIFKKILYSQQSPDSHLTEPARIRRETLDLATSSAPVEFRFSTIFK